MGSLVLGVFFLYQEVFQTFTPKLQERAEALNFLDYYIPFAIFLSVVHALIEEYYWRWFIFRGLMLKFSPLLAGILGSIAFASHHYVVLSQFLPWPLVLLFGTTVGLAGAFWCWLYFQTNSLLGSWISHMIVDAAVMTVGYCLLF